MPAQVDNSIGSMHIFVAKMIFSGYEALSVGKTLC